MHGLRQLPQIGNGDVFLSALYHTDVSSVKFRQSPQALLRYTHLVAFGAYLLA